MQPNGFCMYFPLQKKHLFKLMFCNRQKAEYLDSSVNIYNGVGVFIWFSINGTLRFIYNLLDFD